MSGEAKLTKAEWVSMRRVGEFFRHHSGRLRDSASAIGAPRAVLGSLARKGLLYSTTQEDGARGERRYRYQLYEITPAGRDLLASQNKDADHG